MKNQIIITNSRRRIIALTAGLIVAYSVAFFSSAYAQLISAVDQEQTVLGCSNNSGGDGLAARKGQTFIPTFAGLDAVELYLNGGALGNVNSFLVNIRETNMVGQLVGTSSITTLPVSSGYVIVGFSFPSIVPLTPGHPYCIELVPQVLQDGAFTVRGSCSDSYPGGNYFSGPDSPAGWDAWFRTGLQLKPSIRISQVEVCWATVSNKAYQVQFRSELTTNVWSSLGAPIPGDGTVNCINDPVVPAQPQRFYRVILAP